MDTKIAMPVEKINKALESFGPIFRFLTPMLTVATLIFGSLINTSVSAVGTQIGSVKDDVKNVREEMFNQFSVIRSDVRDARQATKDARAATEKVNESMGWHFRHEVPELRERVKAVEVQAGINRKYPKFEAMTP